ncbi:MAG: hypothetical protein INR71_05620 [Terriglobus roseus]|nr:hypothetical protein [Terriglobus roseus]
MFAATEKPLHWSQRIALVRHNLHSARRDGDFSFFKALQAHAFLEGTDYVATITNNLGGDADAVLSTLDNLNAGVAYVFQDAFKKVHDGLKQMLKGYEEDDDIRARVRAEKADEIQRADLAIDRIVNSVIALIQLQNADHQNDVSCAWILGATIVADAVSVCTRELADIERCIGDAPRLESSWAAVQSSVESAVTALRGILNLMAADEATEDFKRRESCASNPPPTGAMNMLRKFSSVIGTPFYSQHHAAPPPPYKKSRQGSTSSQMSTASAHSGSGLRHGFSLQMPAKPMKTPRTSFLSAHGGGALETIPATPGVVDKDFKFELFSGDDDPAPDEPAPHEQPHDNYIRPKMYVLIKGDHR